MFSPQLQTGLAASWKPCLNLCSQRELKHNLNFVNNWIPFGLWQLKALIPERQINCQSFILKLLDLWIIQSSLIHSKIVDGKEILFEEMFYFEESYIMHISGNKGLIPSRNDIQQIVWKLLKMLYSQHSFLYHIQLSR